jgi:hypothetical protein
MGKGAWMKNVPWFVWVCVTFGFVVLVGAFVILGVTHSDTSDLWDFINRFANVIGAVFGGGALVGSVAAARSAHQAAEQTNGQMKPTMKDAVSEVLDERDAG